MRTHLAVACLLALVAPLQLHADDEPPVGYESVSQAVAPQDPSRISVEEFFWYGCPHCYVLEPALESWAKSKPADVDFQQFPLSLGRDVGILHSQVYYAEVLLGVKDKVHRPLFDAIHVENTPLSSPDELLKFLTAKSGLPEPEVISALNNFMIEANVQRAEELAARYGVFSTPTIVVGGQYKVKAAPPDQQLKVVDALIERIRKERAAAKPVTAAAENAVASSPARAEGGSSHVWLALGGVMLLFVFGLWMVRPR